MSGFVFIDLAAAEERRRIRVMGEFSDLDPLEGYAEVSQQRALDRIMDDLSKPEFRWPLCAKTYGKGWAAALERCEAWKLDAMEELLRGMEDHQKKRQAEEQEPERWDGLS
jgi:hypothetical protein